MTILNDFIGFSYNGRHSSEFNLIRVSNGSRYQEGLIPGTSDYTLEVPGGRGSYYFGSKEGTKTFPINIAFDNVSEEQIREIRNWLCGEGLHELILDERPYKVYMAKLSGEPNFSSLCFMDEYNNRVYKGELNLTFIAYYPLARARRVDGHPADLDWYASAIKKGQTINGLIFDTTKNIDDFLKSYQGLNDSGTYPVLTTGTGSYQYANALMVVENRLIGSTGMSLLIAGDVPNCPSTMTVLYSTNTTTMVPVVGWQSAAKEVVHELDGRIVVDFESKFEEEMIDKYFIIADTKIRHLGINEWAAASGLVKDYAAAGYDKAVGNDDDIASIKLYNPGDIDTDFRLSISAPSTTPLADLGPIILSLGNKSMKILFRRKIEDDSNNEKYGVVTEEEHQLSTITAPRTLIIDTKKKLIEVEIAYENMTVRQPANFALREGNFFQIPKTQLGEKSTLLIEADDVGYTVGNNYLKVTLEYDYLYY